LKEITSVTAASLGGQFHGSLFSMILNAGVMVQFVLLLLLFFSVVSWAIIFMKYRSMKMRGSPTVKETDESLPNLEMKGIDNVERALNRACSAEATKLESTLSFLATTGSASPFIGLFGTVWGIMDTFRGIGTRGSATLAVVAPGISEALIATAAGLAAAIPAVIFYNYYLNKVKDMSGEMDNFASEVLNIIERYYVKK
jgi:biopolymer transport protein TolQ